MASYLTAISDQIGISVWVIVLIFIWSMVWKIMALWKSARKGSVVWFIVLVLTNTFGILPILYIYLFSKVNWGEKRKGSKARKRKK